MIFTWTVAVGCGYLFGVVFGWGLPGIWLAMTLDEWIRGFVLYGRLHSKKWTSKALI